MRSLFKISFLFVTVISTAGVPNSLLQLRDVDIEGISNAVLAATHGQIVQFSQPSTACTFTAEEACSREVYVLIAGGTYTLTVSEVDQHWIIGRWQAELLAFHKCLEDGHSWTSCRGSSGVGGMRGAKAVASGQR
jgi:hypothetical protein